MGTRYPSSAPVTAASSMRARHEVLTSQVDGVKTTFTLSKTPINSPDSVLVLQNQQALVADGTAYNYVGTSLIMVTAPLAGDTLEAYYLYLL